MAGLAGSSFQLVSAAPVTDRGDIIAELERPRESDTVRVIDALAVYQDALGGLEVEHLSWPSTWCRSVSQDSLS
jgi:hypothetical protein